VIRLEGVLPMDGVLSLSEDWLARERERERERERQRQTESSRGAPLPRGHHARVGPRQVRPDACSLALLEDDNLKLRASAVLQPPPPFSY